MSTESTSGMAEERGELIPVALQAAQLGEADVPSRVLILPWGEVKSTAGAFVVDQRAADATLKAFDAHGTDLPVDYEHQTLGGAYSAPNGLAPAAGWVKKLSMLTPSQAAAEGVEPGLWAEVEWTPDAHERLKRKEYRYLSPVALVRRSDRRVVELHSIALTNKPAIAGMKPVVNRDEPVDLRQLLALDDSATEDLVMVAAAHRIRSLERHESLRQASDRVARAFSAGKLTPAQREWALSLAERDPEEFDRWEAAAPRVLTFGRSTAPAMNSARGGSGSIEQAARSEWRAHRAFLEKLCSEEAYVAAAARG